MSGLGVGPVVISARGVTHVYGSGETRVRALDDVDVDVCLGELVAVMGPSGSGKSTLLQLLGGLTSPTSGTVTVSGDDLAAIGRAGRSRVRRRRVGYVFQDLNLIPLLTAIENVALPLELDGLRPATARRHAREALSAMGIDDLAGRFPAQMSGGQQQRVAIARSLVGPRRVVLADEPTGALDSTTGEEVLRVLRARVDAGAAGVVVTHDARLAAWADRVVFLRDGRVVDTAAAPTPETLLGHQATT